MEHAEQAYSLRMMIGHCDGKLTTLSVLDAAAESPVGTHDDNLTFFGLTTCTSWVSFRGRRWLCSCFCAAKRAAANGCSILSVCISGSTVCCSQHVQNQPCTKRPSCSRTSSGWRFDA